MISLALHYYPELFYQRLTANLQVHTAALNRENARATKSKESHVTVPVLFEGNNDVSTLLGVDRVTSDRGLKVYDF